MQSSSRRTGPASASSGADQVPAMAESANYPDPGLEQTSFGAITESEEIRSCQDKLIYIVLGLQRDWSAPRLAAIAILRLLSKVQLSHFCFTAQPPLFRSAHTPMQIWGHLSHKLFLGDNDIPNYFQLINLACLKIGMADINAELFIDQPLKFHFFPFSHLPWFFLL